MYQNVSPEIERVFNQLIWLEQKRFRVIESVAAHFGKDLVARVLAKENIKDSPLKEVTSFTELLDERNPSDFLTYFAHKMEALEASTVTTLRKHISTYQSHVDEQILFGARTAGQEAGRAFLSKVRASLTGRSYLELPEAVQAVFEMTYNGLPEEKNYFLTIRPLAASTIHIVKSPHLESWKSVNGDPKFMYALKVEWIRGILDILSPKVEYHTTQCIEEGGAFGLAHFYSRGIHAGP